VIGTGDARARSVVTEIYWPLHLDAPPILNSDRRTAELTKYAANCFLATKVAFINEIADLAEKVGANVQDVARGIGLDNRIGAKFLHAGPGFGGSCFPKDMMALIKTAQDFETQLRIYRNRRRGQRPAQARDGAQGGKCPSQCWAYDLWRLREQSGFP
jgi:UDPglucose 6-dehydrogenase